MIKGIGSNHDSLSYNMALPLMLGTLYPSGLLGVGLTAMLASFMSGMAGNVTAFKYRMDIRHLSELHRQRQKRRALSMDGQGGHGCRHNHQHRHRISGYGLQQHHGLHAAALFVFQRTAFRHVSSRDVLETDNAMAAAFWGLLIGIFHVSWSLHTDD